MTSEHARRLARTAGVVMAAAAVVALAASAALDLQALAGGPGQSLAGGPGWPYAALGVALTVLAVVVLRHDPRQRTGGALAALGLFWSLDALSQSYVGFSVRPDDALLGADAALWVLNRAGAFLPAAVAVLLMIFPTGRFLPGGWGRACRVALGAMLAAGVGVLVSPMGAGAAAVPLPDDVHLDAWTLPIDATAAARVAPVGLAVQAAGFLVAMASVVVRYRRSSGVERDRLRWLAWSVLVMAVLLPLTLVSDLAAVQSAMLLVVVLVPATAMTVGIVRPGLVPVDDLLARTAVYGALSLVIVVADLAVLAGLTGLLGDALDQRQVVLVVLVLTALLYGPLRLQLGRLVRRVMLGRRADPYGAIAGLASTLETTDDAADQLAAVTRSVADVFGISFVSVEVDRPAGERLVAGYGSRPAQTRTLPITYRDAPIGRLVLPARGLRSRLSRRDEELLGDLVRQAATAARASRMADELQLGRERMVLAREEERRRIRRDLHDGLGPALAGVAFRLESARLLAERDPAAARLQLEAATSDVRDVVADVRRLAHDLRPPVLDDRGLVGALAQLTEQQPYTAELHADGLPALPAAVEVAAYRIAAEALTNATRHAAARRCVVRLGTEDGGLVVEVADDGRGIDPDRQVGVGLLSVRERAEELGGRTEITCPPGGGTHVRAWLPLRSAVAEEVLR
ncbi:sensor histidine kinase [Cellulomonas alba]|uniref:Oxygen sensor histidine kinase NreB n=1 Tax=Cellulomonas alba TaxID=3053467 RepID=A0ABT7SEH9_9CELL|nr:sensor histidine kinase [Cellulomonas alba]MDM7854536.1 sensor histidine kinase [Cellulomonas alba]